MDSLTEINQFKDKTQQAEHEKFMMKKIIDSKQIESQQLNDDNNRIRNILEVERDERQKEFKRLRDQINDLEEKLHQQRIARNEEKENF